MRRGGARKASLILQIVNAGLVMTKGEEKETDTWITPKPRRHPRNPPNSQPDRTQVAAERARAVETATKCRTNSYSALRSENALPLGLDTGSEVSSTGSNKTPHVTPGSVDDLT
ncbi:hypothetical protein NDU88_006640 [Pleurodeles waltl]|uniref:Uncharacterized protein n=1 Tax=Pleurodeles waltl TaxID=8319 RepID=A0AAV7QP51_PLEWA|nr:hypothetical protein NDU88_006640 [Pleurodeles waltl]